jgi:uncharacterized protein YqgC (DUF456 family)
MSVFVAVLIWIAIILLFLASFVGIFVPVIPGAPLIWGGVILYYFAIAPIADSTFWIALVILTILSFVVDYLASVTFVKKWGGSKKTQYAVIFGMIIGPLLMGPIGIVVGPFLMAVIVELLVGSNVSDSLKVGVASFLGLLGGGLAKGLIFIAMIVYFFIVI